MREHLRRKPDLKFDEMREAFNPDCTLPDLHCVLVDLGLTYNKDTRGLWEFSQTFLQAHGC